MRNPRHLLLLLLPLLLGGLVASPVRRKRCASLCRDDIGRCTATCRAEGEQCRTVCHGLAGTARRRCRRSCRRPCRHECRQTALAACRVDTDRTRCVPPATTTTTTTGSGTSTSSTTTGATTTTSTSLASKVDW